MPETIAILGSRDRAAWNNNVVSGFNKSYCTKNAVEWKPKNFVRHCLAAFA